MNDEPSRMRSRSPVSAFKFDAIDSPIEAPPARNLDRNPYTREEQRVREFFQKLQPGCGDGAVDPLGSLMDSFKYYALEYKLLQEIAADKRYSSALVRRRLLFRFTPIPPAKDKK